MDKSQAWIVHELYNQWKITRRSIHLKLRDARAEFASSEIGNISHVTMIRLNEIATRISRGGQFDNRVDLNQFKTDNHYPVKNNWSLKNKIIHFSKFLLK